MPRPSREAEILEAALDCFAARGYDATRVRHIAQRAGVSEAALYRHHPSKEAIGQALYTTHMGRYATSLQAAATDPTTTVEARVKTLVKLSLDARREHPAAHAFVLTHQARFIDALPADFPYPVRIVDALLAEGQRAGHVRPGPIRVLSALVVGCMSYPAIVAQHAAAGTIDLDAPGVDDVIADGAWGAVAST